MVESEKSCLPSAGLVRTFSICWQSFGGDPPPLGVITGSSAGTNITQVAILRIFAPQGWLFWWIFVTFGFGKRRRQVPHAALCQMSHLYVHIGDFRPKSSTKLQNSQTLSLPKGSQWVTISRVRKSNIFLYYDLIRRNKSSRFIYIGLWRNDFFCKNLHYRQNKHIACNKKLKFMPHCFINLKNEQNWELFYVTKHMLWSMIVVNWIIDLILPRGRYPLAPVGQDRFSDHALLSVEKEMVDNRTWIDQFAAIQRQENRFVNVADMLLCLMPAAIEIL